MPLINLAKYSNIYATEMGITALANLFLDRQIVEEALADDIIPPLSRVLREGTIRGKWHAVAALARLVHHGPIDDVFIEGIHHCGTVLNMTSLVCTTNLEGKVKEEALEALSLLAKENRGGALNHPLWTTLAKAPCNLEPLIICLVTDIPPIQEKAIEVMSRIEYQPVIFGDMVIETPKCIIVLGDRIIHSSSLEVKVGGTALLICAAKEHRQKMMEALNASGFFVDLIHSLVDLVKQGIDINGYAFVKFYESNECSSKKHLMEWNAKAEGGKPFSELDSASVLGGIISLWLLSIVASHDSKCKILMRNDTFFNCKP